MLLLSCMLLLLVLSHAPRLFAACTGHVGQVGWTKAVWVHGQLVLLGRVSVIRTVGVPSVSMMIMRGKAVFV
jgi:hypothetical protein